MSVSSYPIDIRRPDKQIYSIPLARDVERPNGDRISFTNYFMELNGKPFLGVCGEFHYARYSPDAWEDEILKIKMGGVNIIASYIFWIHHEEIQGQYRWDDRFNLRAFVELCAKHGMYFIARVGPFSHGEARNGGFPDWLFGRSFELRSNDPAYLELVKGFYSQISQQLQGLFFQDNGPIIAVQLENEYMHASAPWEVIPRQSHEWIGAGNEGTEHMRILKDLALETGLIAPFYTSTGWGGSPVLEGEILPLYGGYAFCPWNVDQERPIHAPTREYLFQHFHKNGETATGFEPPYNAEDYPFACCEMGGGMQVWYQYRFVVPGVSVEAQALHKLAGGCNFLGYYMYHGGSNPVGQRAYFNEYVTPKISYDFQAPLGEFGQTRESYHRLRLLHLFLQEFSEQFARTATVLPANPVTDPHNVSQLRYAARVQGESGFVFLNNFQDHIDNIDLDNIKIALESHQGTITIPSQHSLSLPRDSCALLPFNIWLGDLRLISASNQLITRCEQEHETVYFFFTPEGFPSEYSFDRTTMSHIEVEGGTLSRHGDRVTATLSPAPNNLVRITTTSGQNIVICSLEQVQAWRLWQADVYGQRRIIITAADVLPREDGFELQSWGQNSLIMGIYPPIGELAVDKGQISQTINGMFQHVELQVPAQRWTIDTIRHSDRRVSLRIPPEVFEHDGEVLLRIHYRGDVGYASVNGELIHDNFSNGTAWEIGLKHFADKLAEARLDLYISPLRQGRTIMSDSAMAVQQTFVGEEIAEIISCELVPQYRVKLTA
jgi:hypothetical protein